jgi:prepilin-type N-terminal cleavage/methylation domain-containing protein
MPQGGKILMRGCRRATQKKKMNKTMQDLLLKENKGVTLIELMIALVIAAILVAGTYSIFISQQRTYIAQDQIVGAQQDGRTALTIMARDIRMAGMLTGVNGFSVWDGSANATEAITPTNSSAGPDQLRVVYAAEEFSTGTPPTPVQVTNVVGSVVTLSQPIGTFFNANTGGTTDRSYVAFEGNNLVYLIASGGVSGSTLTFTTSPPDNLASYSARVFRVRAITYRASGTTLQRNDGEGAQTLAGATNQSQVEDLQFAYQVTGVNYWTFDGVVDTAHGETSDTALPAGTTNADIRAVKINLLMKTPIEDTKDQNYSRPALEDRAGSATQDGFRRRVYTTVVKLRNF